MYLYLIMYLLCANSYILLYRAIYSLSVSAESD